MSNILIELAAEAAWKRDYPNGGSLYPTYESTNFQDKEIYRKEVAPIVAVVTKRIAAAILPKDRLANLEAHMDEGGKTDNAVVYELLGYIKELLCAA